MMDWFGCIYWSGFVIAFFLTFYYYDEKDGGLLPIMILVGFIWPLAFVIALIAIIYQAKECLEKWKHARQQRNDSSGNKAV